MDKHQIRYFLLTERDPATGNMLLPPMCGSSLPVFSFLGRYPQSLEHYVLGVDYYTIILRHQIQAGYFFNVVYIDSLKEQIAEIKSYDGIQLFFITVSSQTAAIELRTILSANHNDNICYQPINMSKEYLNTLPNFINDYDDFLSYLHKNINNFILQDALQEMTPYCVPIPAGEIERRCFFQPTQVNLLTTQCIWGNWGAPLVDDLMIGDQSIELIKQEGHDAVINSKKFERQQIFVKQLNEVDIALKYLYDIDSIVSPGLGVSLFSPIIISAPFNSPAIKEELEIKKEDSQKDVDYKKLHKRIFETEQSPNYTLEINYSPNESDIKQIITIGCFLLKRRLMFLDNAGYLHSSFKFSPYVRLPLIGKSIYGQLSSVGAKSGMQLIRAGKIHKIHKKVKAIGDILSDRLLSPELKDSIKKRNAQIVSISDMPIEWIQIDNVPLGFSHDICRIPESPNGGILAQYMSSKNMPMDIPENILEHTLVVFGATDSRFAIWQEAVVELSKQLNFKTCICKSIERLKNQIEEHNPLLLIIDSHGGIDEENRQSFLMLGSEKLTGDNVVKYGIVAPLIFLSACSTAPTYSPTNIIANAFFEIGAKAVTSTYLPLSVDVSSVTYLRLLNQLSQCSKQSIHNNWLSFISHILRTSHIMQPYTKALLEGKLKNMEKAEEQSSLIMESMFFSKRRKVYHTIKKGFVLDGKSYNTDIVSPEYLFYSNLGRSDLIFFTSWKKENEKRIEESSIRIKKIRTSDCGVFKTRFQSLRPPLI